MRNKLVAMTMQGETITLNIPLFIVETLDYFRMSLYPSKDENAHISVEEYNGKEYKIHINIDSVIITEIVPSELILFKLFIEIEDYIMRRKIERDNTAIALHGGGVIYNGNSILVLQGKGSGKSTLIAKLAQRSTKYLSDDLIVSYGNRVLGIPLPIRLRNLDIPGLNEVKRQQVVKSLDFDGKDRFLYMPKIESNSLEVPISTILIPHYRPDLENKIVQIKGNEKFDVIVNQVKRYIDIENLYKNVVEISQNATMYHLYYRDFSILDILFSTVFK